MNKEKLSKNDIVTKAMYKNCFGREGKKLHSEIFMQKGCFEYLDKILVEVMSKESRASNNYIITDSIVDKLYGDQIENKFEKAGIKVKRIIVSIVDTSIESETHKSIDTLVDCCNNILENGVSKHSSIISVGGGVVNNIAGVIASLIYRGINLIHIPTSLMAIIDAAIDFKQAVNHYCGKNLIGSYYPASSIIIDPKVLKTLPKRHVLNGLSEGLKHGLTQSRDVIDMIVEPIKKDNAILEDDDFLEKVCQKVIELKIPTLITYNDSDYNEMVPQYGHAIGHAIEHLSQDGVNHSSLFHGEALSIGMCLSTEIGLILGICDKKLVDEHYKIMEVCELPVFIPNTMTTTQIVNKISYDKHFFKKMHIGLIEEIGRMALNKHSYAWEIDNDTLLEAIC